jgi:hypothetical protein
MVVPASGLVRPKPAPRQAIRTAVLVESDGGGNGIRGVRRRARAGARKALSMDSCALLARVADLAAGANDLRGGATKPSAEGERALIRCTQVRPVMRGT